MLTAATARRDYLEPSLDGRALNDTQRQMLHNETPEVDSLIEYLHELPPHHFRDAAIDLVHRLLDSNGREAECERRIAGAADQLVRELRGAELRGASAAITAQGVARAARRPLAVICGRIDADADERIGAFAALHDLIARTPRSQLLAPTVRREIGQERFELLSRLAGAGEAH